MKKLFGLGIFVLIFMLSVGLSFAAGYESDVDPAVFNTWQPITPMMQVDPGIGTISAYNATNLNKTYVGADIYVMSTQRGRILLAYRLHTKDGELLCYELDVLSFTYVSVESLDAGFIKRFNNRVAVRNKLMQESTQ